MPWIFNPNRTAVPIVKNSGEHCYIPGKGRIYFHPDQLNSSIGAKLQSGALKNLGGDPESVLSLMAAKQVVGNLDTSSELHEVPVTVQADSPPELVEEIIVEVAEPVVVSEVADPEPVVVEASEPELAESTEDKSGEPDPAYRSRKSRRGR